MAPTQCPRARAASALTATAHAPASAEAPALAREYGRCHCCWRGCARPAASSVDRYRQWQILGGGFGENYDILPPEEEELDEESKKESDEQEEFENDLSSFLEQVISVHVRRQLNKGKSWYDKITRKYLFRPV